MTDRTKLLVVHTGAGTPESVDVSLVDLREAVLNKPEVLVEALRDLVVGQGPSSTGGDLPLDTPITKMVSPELAIDLTPNIRKLTKADLLALGDPAKVTELKLSIADLRAIEAVFHQDYQQGLTAGAAGLDEDEAMGGEAALSVSCCSCCPCCCCTAAVDLDPIQALA